MSFSSDLIFDPESLKVTGVQPAEEKFGATRARSEA